MNRFIAIFLTALLLLPFAAATVEAKVKSTAAQVHVVKRGDSLYEIAQRHGLTVKELKYLNGLSSNRLKIGQKLALTKAAAPPLPQTAKASSSARKQSADERTHGDQSFHVVKKGDSLYSIARRHGITVKQLQALNGLNGNRLKIGQQLVLSDQRSGNEDVVVTAAASKASGKYSAPEQHVVKKGDTLAAIARRHRVSVNELKRLNGLRSTKLKIGQRLALADPYEQRNPILLPGDASEDEILEMAYSADSEIEQVAFNFLSIPYRFGGNSQKGIDCSAFVQQVFREMDVKLPRSAREQFRVGTKIERDELQPGDLVFFRTYARFPSHVGIYLGDNKMIHASSRSRRVVVTSLDFPYYRKRYIGAKRITLLDRDTDVGLQDVKGDVVEAVDTADTPDTETDQAVPAAPTTDGGKPMAAFDPLPNQTASSVDVVPAPVN